MFAAGKTAAVSGETPDAQFNYVTMLLHGDGTNGAQNNTFLDSSTNNFTITRNGNTTQGSFSPYGSNWSSYFNSATPDYFTFANSSNFAFGTGNFTIEFWFNASSALNDKMILDFRNGGSSNNLVISTGGYTGSAGSLRYASGSIDITSGSTLICNGLWNHCAVVRSGTTVTLYVNGVSTATGTDSSNFSATSGTNYFGRNSYGSGTEISGYFSNCRIVKGTAVYTSGFTPSTTPLTAVSGTSLLTFQSNRFVDNSGNSVTLTANGTPSVQRFNPFGASAAYSTSVIGGSGYFDGSGDRLEVSTNSAFNISSGDFTMEAWVYYTSRPSSNVMSINSGSGVDGIYYLHGANPAVYVASGGGWNIMSQDVSSYLPLNCWNHTALVRNGDLWRIYINGVSVYSTTNSSSISFSTTPLRIGASGGGSQPTFGYIADARLVKGTAVYTGSTYTVPTAPLTAITNTSLLAKMTNGAIFDNAMMNDLETVGNAQISTSVKKYGTGSLAFDGTGDWLVVGNPSTRPILDFGAGDFTIEAWVYPNGTSPYLVIGSLDNSSGVGCWWLVVNGTFGGGGTIQFGYNTTAGGSGTNILAGSGALSTSTWSHIAVTRSGANIRCFVNGTQVGTTNTGIGTSAIYPVNQNILVGETVAGASYGMNGYIDDLRITKGYARYTSNFTAPTAAFPNIGPV